MKKYRISKYKPWLRDEKGRYLKNEWTSFSDIGRSYDSKILSTDEYEYVENKYIQVLKMILNDKGINKLVVTDLQKNFTIEEIECMLNSKNLCLKETEKKLFMSINNGSELSIDNVEVILILLLRESIWCKLINSMNNFIVEFGYDFYIYIYCNNISQSLLNEIKILQVYIEELDI